jgi:hypothetical protein
VTKDPKSVQSHPRNTIAIERKGHSWGKIRHGLRHRDFGSVAVAVVAAVVVEEEEDHVVVRVVAVAPVRIVDAVVDVDVVVVVAVAPVVLEIVETDVPEWYTVPFCNSTIESSHPLLSHRPSIPMKGVMTKQLIPATGFHED